MYNRNEELPVNSERILYTPSIFARTNLIHLQETGRLVAKLPHTSHRDNLSSYLFFIVESGCGALKYHEQEYSLHRGDCVFIDCRHPYTHSTSKEPWTLSWIHFYGPNMSGIYEKYVERGGTCCFHPNDPTLFIKILTEVYTIAGSSDYVKDMRIFEKLTGLLTLLMEESWHPDKKNFNSTKRRSLQEVKDYLDRYYMEKINLDMLSEMFFINKFYLSRIFKEQFGVTINTYLLQVRITHAKQLLRFSDSSVEKISSDCGFTDANYFSRSFRKFENISPMEFRKKWQF